MWDPWSLLVRAVLTRVGYGLWVMGMGIYPCLRWVWVLGMVNTYTRMDIFGCLGMGAVRVRIPGSKHVYEGGCRARGQYVP